jgi:hypothetical protein
MSRPDDKPKAPKPPVRANPAGKEKDLTFLPKSSGLPSGRVQFDDRGNAIWEWSVATGASGREASTQRMHKLENSSLSLADDAPTPAELTLANPLGTKHGYDPYESGKLSKSEKPRPKNLKKLGEMLALRKQAEENKRRK